MVNFSRITVTSPVQLDTCWKQAQKKGLLGYDLETSGLDAFTEDVLLIQLGVETKEGIVVYIIPARDCVGEIKKKLQGILEDSKITKIGHNLLFDYKFTFVHYATAMSNVYDTRLAEACLTLGKGLQNGLKNVVERRLGFSMDKSVRINFIGRSASTNFTDEELDYAAEDVAVLFDIYRSQLEEAEPLGLLKVIKLENAVLPVTAELELNGVLIDVNRWSELTAEYELKCLELVKNLYATLDMNIPIQSSLFSSSTRDDIDAYVSALNINSPLQVGNYLKKLGVELEDTSKMTMEKNKHKHPLIADILAYRKSSKLLTSFMYPIPSMRNAKTKRWHPEYVQLPVFEEAGTSGASTGRYASRNFNYQQLPQNNNLRNCFIARPGYKIITADYASMEVRIATNISGDEALIKFFHLNQEDMPVGADGNKVKATDFHGYCASLLFGKPLELVAQRLDVDGKELDPIDPGPRKIAKSVTFALFYGATAPGIAPHLGKSVKDCQELVDLYYAKFPRLMKKLDWYGEEALKNGWVEDCIGRKKFFDVSNLTTKSERNRVIRQSKNMPIQGANASMTKRALFDLRKRFSNTEFRFYATVHDEIVAEVPEDKAQYISTEMTQIMVKSASLCLDGAIDYGATCHIAPHWTK
jgi:DNA polymerase-1